MSSPEVWIECKKPCADCPERTKRTAKLICQHPWRCVIDELVQKSEDLSAQELAECVSNGATVATGYLETGSRPSLQMYAQQPAQKPHLNQIKIV